MRTERGNGRALLRLAVKTAAAAALLWALFSFVLGIFIVHSNAMHPAVRDGDLLITWRLGAPARGDVIAYTAGGERHFGRVFAVAGDVVEPDGEGYIRLNGTAAFETVYYATYADPTAAVIYPYTVPEGSVFVLNDMREDSADSRRFGAIALSDTDGLAALRLRRRSW